MNAFSGSRASRSSSPSRTSVRAVADKTALVKLHHGTAGSNCAGRVDDWPLDKTEISIEYSSGAAGRY